MALIIGSTKLLQLMNGGMLNLTLIRRNQLNLTKECVTDFFPIIEEFSFLFFEHLQ